MPELRRYLRPPRKLTFTLEGRWFVGITMIVGFGAMNTGNNLLYLVLGMLLGLIIASGVLSERVLKEVKVKRVPPGDLFANRPAHLAYEVSNHKRVFASYSLTVGEHEDAETRGWRRVSLGLPAERPRRKKDREREGDPGTPKALLLKVPAEGSRVGVATYVFPRRGLYRFVGMDLATRFPFGFFEKSRRIEVPTEVIVYPEVRERSAVHVEDTPLIGEVARRMRGRTGDYFGLREYREGEDLRDVHWKVSARRNVLVRRLYEREDNESIALYLHNWAPDDAPASLAVVEEAITEVASTCAHLAREGIRFSLTTIDGVVSEGAGSGQLKACLRHLALIDVPTGGDPPALRVEGGANRVLFASPETPMSVRAPFEWVHVAEVAA